MVKNPPLLLCDEPTGALDVATGRQILGQLRATTVGGERSVFLVTHNSEIAKMADRVIRLRDGEIVDNKENPSPAPVAELNW
jgi:putative ABC transport system ATP-binding protein